MNCFACLLARVESELRPEYVYGMVPLVGIEIGSQRHLETKRYIGIGSLASLFQIKDR